MTCYEKVLDNLPFILHEGIKEDYKISDSTLTRINKLGEVECEGLCYIVDFAYNIGQHWESFLIDYLNGIDKPKLDKKVKDLSTDNMWDRWERGGRVSKKELSLIIGCSVDKIEGYCSKSAGVYLKSYSSGTGANVYFKKSDWEKYEPYLER